jgi:hypothetical protein
MAKLKWGKMKVEIAQIINGVIGVFTEVSTPVKDSFTLNVEEGDKLEAFIEGGERIDVRKDANKYAFEFDAYIGQGMDKPIDDLDGIIPGEYAIRVTPEDDTLPGFLMERASVSVAESFTSQDGHKAKYTFEALKPVSGAMLKPYSNLSVTPGSLSFASTADTTGQTITVTATGTVAAASDQSWATVTVSNKVVTVKVAANTGAARTAHITISADGKQTTVVVIQAGA